MNTSNNGTATNLNQGNTSISIPAALVNEEKEKEKRQLNLIMYNIKESNDADSFKRKEEDVSAAATILRDYLNVPLSVNECY